MNSGELPTGAIDLGAQDYLQPIEKLVTLGTAADAIGVPYFKILRAAKAGLFPCYKVGNQRALVRLTEVVSAIERSSLGADDRDEIVRPGPAFDPNNRLQPFDVAATLLHVPVALIQEAANSALFPSQVDASGLRVAKLSSIAVALVRMCELQRRSRSPAARISVMGGSNV